MYLSSLCNELYIAIAIIAMADEWMMMEFEKSANEEYFKVILSNLIYFSHNRKANVNTNQY